MTTTTTRKPFFAEAELSQLDPKKIPYHIAIIPDGNRRWAMERSQTHAEGHTQGCEVIMDTTLAAQEMGICVITFFAFSTENWNRSTDEVECLMNLVITYLQKETEHMVEEGIRFETIGDLSPLPHSVKKQITESKEATKGANKIVFVMAINYGGRDEIVRAARSLCQQVEEGSLSSDAINARRFAEELDTAPYGDPELFIRTSGETRISNFLLWQLSYTELYMPDVLWPNFTPHHLYEGVVWHQNRDKRIGK